VLVSSLLSGGLIMSVVWKNFRSSAWFSAWASEHWPFFNAKMVRGKRSRQVRNGASCVFIIVIQFLFGSLAGAQDAVIFHPLQMMTRADAHIGVFLVTSRNASAGAEQSYLTNYLLIDLYSRRFGKSSPVGCGASFLPGPIKSINVFLYHKSEGAFRVASHECMDYFLSILNVQDSDLTLLVEKIPEISNRISRATKLDADSPYFTLESGKRFEFAIATAFRSGSDIRSFYERKGYQCARLAACLRFRKQILQKLSESRVVCKFWVASDINIDSKTCEGSQYRFAAVKPGVGVVTYAGKVERVEYIFHLGSRRFLSAREQRSRNISICTLLNQTWPNLIDASTNPLNCAIRHTLDDGEWLIVLINLKHGNSVLPALESFAETLCEPLNKGCGRAAVVLKSDGLQ
jgi:hypothetical protein